MKIKIEKGVASGTITAPASKSHSHRLLIAAAMCQGESVIEGISLCDDVMATIDCLRAFGAKIEIDGANAKVQGIDFTVAKAEGDLNCRESGSTIRFLIPLAMLSENQVRFVGSKSLMSRPFGVYEEIALGQGLIFRRDGGIVVGGALQAGEYSVRGDVSSQFVTGLIFALSLLKEDSKIKFTTAIESRPYIDLTISSLSEFGVKIAWEGDRLVIKGGQEYHPATVSVEGDFSGAAFVDALNFIGGEVSVEGLNSSSEQADRVYPEYFEKLSEGFSQLNIENCPDLAPILFTLATLKHGAEFIGTRRLKIKESDRAEVMRAELSKFGADISVEENRVIVKKAALHTPTEALCGHNDHRVVMSLAVLCSIFGGIIEGAEAISKSYPDFFGDLEKIGIKAYEIR